MVLRGINAGQEGTVEEIKEGTFTLPKRILISLGTRQIEIPSNLTMAVGKESPILQLK